MMEDKVKATAQKSSLLQKGRFSVTFYITDLEVIFLLAVI